jgi:hypothetical protein
MQDAPRSRPPAPQADRPEGDIGSTAHPRATASASVSRAPIPQRFHNVPFDPKQKSWPRRHHTQLCSGRACPDHQSTRSRVAKGHATWLRRRQHQRANLARHRSDVNGGTALDARGVDRLARVSRLVERQHVFHTAGTAVEFRRSYRLATAAAEHDFVALRRRLADRDRRRNSG